MRQRFSRTVRGLVLLAPFLITASVQQGCSSGGYENARDKMAAASIIVSPDTLNGWLTQGYGTDSFGYDKLVVLEASSVAGYATEHIRGAIHVDAGTEVNVSRSDGIGGNYSYSYTDPVTSVTTRYADINAPAQVATREMMNAVIQRTGIDRNTVVAIAGDSVMNAALLYFDFRYWGFPKERLRVLDRSKGAWKAAGFPVTTDVPAAPAPSTYSVCNLPQNTSLRASLADMIRLADGQVPDAVAWDVREVGEYSGVAGSTAGPFAGKPGYAKKVAFEGHVRGAVNLEYWKMLSADKSTILDEATVRTAALAAGFGPGIRTHVY